MKRKKFWSLFWTPLTLLQLIQASEHQNEIKTTFQETSDNLENAASSLAMMAQPVFQEPPPAFSHSSTSYWSNPGAYETGAEVCRETQNDFVEARDHLFQVKETLLERIDCGGNKNCTKVIVSSIGKSLVRHPPRFGLYSLETLFEGYPAYARKASQQTLFYKEEYEKWIYAHKFERWVIGPTIGDENGGVVLLSEEVCPWNIDFDETDMYFYDRLVYNTWNPIGNGWRLENGMIAIECWDPEKYPPYSCQCNVVNVTSQGGRISEYHSQKLGLYHLEPHTFKLGFLAPVYKKEGNPAQYLYSHHHEGRFWLLGQSYTSWSIRLDLVSKFKEDIIIPPEDQYQGVTKHGKIGAFCPMQKPLAGTYWEYLQSRSGENEIWLKDAHFRIHCVG